MMDASGAIVRSYSSKPKPGAKPEPPAFPGAPPPISQLLPAKQGMNQIAWNLRSDAPVRVPGIYSPEPPEGYRVAAGEYKLKLSLGAKSVTESFAVAGDPRVPHDEAEEKRTVEATKTIYDRINEVNHAAIILRSVRDQLDALSEHNHDRAEFAEFDKSIKEIRAEIAPIESRLLDIPQKTQQDEVNFRHGLADQYGYLQAVMEDAPLTAAERDRFAELDKEWADWQGKIKSVMADVAAFNARAREKGIPVVSDDGSH